MPDLFRDSNVEAILFDFFGTLVTYDRTDPGQFNQGTMAPIYEFLSHVDAEVVQKHWSDVYREFNEKALLSYCEFSMEQWIGEVVRRCGGYTDLVNIKELTSRFLREWSKPIEFPSDTLEVIPKLTRNFKLGIVSNTHSETLTA